jgi:DNA-binding NarL/FixJ family response regulator
MFSAKLLLGGRCDQPTRTFNSTEPITMKAQASSRPPKAKHGKVIDVMIADDHPLIVEGLAMVLHGFGLRVTARASEGHTVVDTFRTAEPDVLVLDLRFCDGVTGLDAARELLETMPQARIVIYSQFDQDAVLREAYELGVMAFVTKDANPQLLVDAIRRAHEGKTYFMPHIAERLALLSVRGGDSPVGKLAPRELEVFKLMAEGRTNIEIAELMGLSPKTISTTSQGIKEQLGVHRAADITLLAVRHGLINV